MALDINYAFPNHDTIEQCKGIVYRASVNCYQGSRQLGFSIKLRKRIKLSCSGCSRCNRLRQAIEDEIFAFNRIMGIEDCQHGKLYEVYWHLEEEGNPYIGTEDDWVPAIKEYREDL